MSAREEDSDLGAHQLHTYDVCLQGGIIWSPIVRISSRAIYWWTCWRGTWDTCLWTGPVALNFVLLPQASSVGGPLLVRKNDFMTQGLFRTEMHCPTEEYDEMDGRNSFAHEYSMRVWNSGADVGLYSANWTAVQRMSPQKAAADPDNA